MVKFVSADGRSFTDYRPDCQMNVQIMNRYGITNAYNYRQFLQQNAIALMQRDRIFARDRNILDCNCWQCVKLSKI